MIKSLNQAIKFLEGYIPIPEKKHPGELGLRRMQYLMQLLDNPQLKYPTIHVGGTSGKGSTSTIIASIFSTKYKVGLHTSPHIVRINERIKIFSKIKNQKSKIKNTYQKSNIEDEKFVELLNSIIPTINAVEKSKFGAPSYFEIVAAMAFLYFYREKVDIAVIEVGMGGRYDATNVIKPLVAVITNVGLDHTEILGDTVEKIAKDKAGIIKPGIEVVSGVRQSSVREIVKRKALSVKRKGEKNNLSLLVPPPLGSLSSHPRGVFEAFSYRVGKLDSEGSVFDYKGDNLLKDLKIRLLGEHQVENAAVAIRTVEVSRGPLIKEQDIKLGLLNAYIPGRLEIVKRNPLVILDGAHNQNKVRALATSIKKIFPNKRVTSIMAIKNDKNAKEMLAEILKLSKKIIFTEFELTGDVGIISSYDPRELLKLAKTIDRAKPMSIIESAKKAVEEAIKSAKSNDLILVTGSLYLVGGVKRVLRIK